MSSIKYKGSELYKNIEYTNDIDQLHNMCKYIDGAIGYHQCLGDIDNIDFFKEAQKHWQSKVKIVIRKSKRP
jgi:hypothetical protein